MSKTVTPTIGTTPTLIHQSTSPNVESVIIDVLSGSDVTLGGPSVVAGAGPILKTTSQPQTVNVYQDAIYGICATASAQVAAFIVLSDSGR